MQDGNRVTKIMGGISNKLLFHGRQFPFLRYVPPDRYKIGDLTLYIFNQYNRFQCVKMVLIFAPVDK